MPAALLTVALVGAFHRDHDDGVGDEEEGEGGKDKDWC